MDQVPSALSRHTTWSHYRRSTQHLEELPPLLANQFRILTGTILAWSVFLLPSRDIISTQTVTRRESLHCVVNIEMKESQLWGDALCDLRNSLHAVHPPSTGIREATDLLVSLDVDLQASSFARQYVSSERSG